MAGENYFFKRNYEEVKELEDLKDMKELNIEELKRMEDKTGSLAGLDIEQFVSKAPLKLPPIQQ